MFAFAIIILLKIQQMHQFSSPTQSNFTAICLAEIIKHNLDLDSFFTILTTPNISSQSQEIRESLLENINQQMKWSVETIVDHEVFLAYIPQPKFYLSIVESLEDFLEIFQTMNGLSNYNPDAIFLIYCPKVEDFESILTETWAEFMPNTLLLIPRESNLLELYSFEWNFQANFYCLKANFLKLQDSCIDGRLMKPGRYTKTDYGRGFNRCKLNAIAMVMEPFVINQKKGLEIQLLRIVGDYLNVTFEITLSNEDFWGEKVNGAWTNCLGIVYNDSYVGVGNFFSADEYTDDFEFTTSHFKAHSTWIVPISHFIPEWRALTTVFKWRVWLISILLILVFPFLFRITSDQNYRNFGNNFLMSIQIIIATPVSKLPKGDFTRIFFISLAMLSIILSSAYTTSLINNLTRPKREYQIQTVEDIVNSGFDVGGLPNYRRIYEDGDEISQEIYSKFQVNESLDIWLTSVADDRDTCTIFNTFYIEYQMSIGNPFLLDADNLSKVFIFDSVVISNPLSMVVRRGYPFLEEINGVVLQIVQLGLIDKLAEKYVERTRRIEALQKTGSVVQKLSLDHLQSAFALLVLGYLGSLLALFAVYLFLLTLWWGLTWETASACPYSPIEEIVEGARDFSNAALLIFAQLLGALVTFRYVQILWAMELVETHRDKAFEECVADLQVHMIVGALIEAAATCLCRLTSKIIAETETKYGNVLDAFFGTMMVVVAFNFSGGYFNPALATSLKLGCRGNTFVEHMVVYWIGATLGSVISVLLFRSAAVQGYIKSVKPKVE